MIYLNDVQLLPEKFPNGETRLNHSEINKNTAKFINHIDFKYETDEDLIHLMFIKNYLDEHGYDASLRILYMPYSRMDRSENGSVFTLKYVCKFINSLNFKNVTVVEPHSDVTLALLDKSVAVYPTMTLLNKVEESIGFDKESDYLFFPDAGASKRYNKLKGYKTLTGNKTRNFQTGVIEGLDVLGKVDNTKKVIILDDLSSFGGTFIASAEKLKDIGFEEIYLFVGHCEHSIYKGKILTSSLIDKVFTTNSILTESNDVKIHIFDIIGVKN